MLRSCPYCGLIHPSGETCQKKPTRGKVKPSRAALFRKSWSWQKKRDRVVQRDFHLCRACNDGMYGVFGIPGLNQDLSVHHIEPLEESFDLRLEDDNLVTLCWRHHEMAEAGEIPREYLHGLAAGVPRWGIVRQGQVRQD